MNPSRLPVLLLRWFTLCMTAGALLPPLDSAALDDLVISEFMAVNVRTLPDEDGDFPDWIEIHNAGTNLVSLSGWFLTDKATDLRQWPFPATNLFPNGYLVVFASGKDRRVAGAPLHANFKLSGDGEYLALVRPGGTNVAFAYAPAFPLQVGGVSYGVPIVATERSLIPAGSPARVFLPFDDALGKSWVLPGFDDTGWADLTTGVGYELDGQEQFSPSTLADSVTGFSGVQGQGGWFYGYWNHGADGDGTYTPNEFVPFPAGPGPWSAVNFWTGSAWDWFGGDPPFTQVTARGGQGSGNATQAGAPDHAVVRRYVSSTEGPVKITGRLAHTSDWIRVEATGVFPAGTSPLLYIYQLGTGEGYLDDVTLVSGVVAESGPNLVAKGDFETASLSPEWTVSPNLSGSALTTTVRHRGDSSLHVVSRAGGSTQTNAIWQGVPSLVPGQVYTLSYWYLPDTNSSPLVVRCSGGWINTTPEYCGDGVVGRVLIDGQEVFSRSVRVQSFDYAVPAQLQVGSTIDFILDPGPFRDGDCDFAEFTGRVETQDASIVVVADSAADWSVTGRQGERNWSYGYWDAGTNAVPGVYRATNFTVFPHEPGPLGATNFWDGEKWVWGPGSPPDDEIGPDEMLPNGLNNRTQHWVIRRWLSTVRGTVTVDWTLIKLEAAGGGVSAHVFHNGVQRDGITLPGTNAPVIQRSVVISGVREGDTLDFALDPAGVGGTFGNGGDRCRFSAVIRGVPSLTRQIATDITGDMSQATASAYLRMAFEVAQPSEVQFLSLRMKYDDGFVAYLNGQQVISANAPAEPQWNSTAVQARPDLLGREFEEFNLTAWLGLLQPGRNVLAIHGLNRSAGDSDFLILPELVATRVEPAPQLGRYFTAPTPGQPNGPGSARLAPFVAEAVHVPAEPADDEDLVVTARVVPTLLPVGQARLIYRVMYGPEVTLPMFDDGAHADGAAGDGVYGARVPAAAAAPGQMLRYSIRVTDTGGNQGRFPAFDDPRNSPEYLGTVVRDPGLTNPLPVLQMFVQNPVLATNAAGTRCTLAYGGEFYDNVAVNLHGQTTAAIFQKRSMNIDLNRGQPFRWDPASAPVRNFNLLTPLADKAYVRQLLSYETFARAGVPTHFAFPVRVQQNGAFFGIFHFVEKGDEQWLERVGLDPKGALYKVYLPLTNAYAGVAEKKTRQDEANTDLQALVDGLNQGPEAARRFLYDQVDIPEVVNFLATLQLVQNEDCCFFKNYYLYRDTEGTREWQMMPWDLDLTLGRTFNFFQVGGILINGYFNTNIYWTNAFYTQIRADALNFIGISQPLVDAILGTPSTLDMFLRRWSTVHDRFLQPTNTHPLLNYFERRIDELVSQIAPDAPADLAKWGSWAPTQNLAVAVGVLKTDYLARRRGWIFDTLRYERGGPYLSPQPTNTLLRFGAIEFNPASGNQAEEYLQLTNPNPYAVDLSGWTVRGAIDFVVHPGTVLPSNSVLYLSPDVNAFRARRTGPRGGQGLFVQGSYRGQLSARGELLELVDGLGRVVQGTNYAGNPSLAQQFLRVTEIMYHPPPPPPGLLTNAEAFEYVELQNTGGVPLDLSGVRFTAGIEFNFTGSSVTSLAPGASVAVVRNRTAFLSRYPSAPPIAGEFSGSLDNAGELIRLEDATGEKILEFAYDPSWYRITDGAGFSLVIRDPSAPYDTWGLAGSWRPSGGELGSPGLADPQPSSIPAVRVEELLANSEPPAVDFVEVYNPTAGSVNLRGWFLTDDFATPKKFVIPADVLLAPGGRHVFEERDFNPAPGTAPSFAFSSQGDEVYLFSADLSGRLTGYYHGFHFGASDPGVTFGRQVTSTREERFVSQVSSTPGAANSGPRVGPVLLDQIQFHPPDLADGSDNTADEFVLLHNVSAGPVALFDPARPTNTWRLAGALQWAWPPGVSLAADGRLIVAGFDPADAARLASFRSRHRVPPEIPVHGPFSGKLDNSGEAIELLRPGLPELGGVPFILVERVGYRDGAPWPAGADGTGAALVRRVPVTFGDDPASWYAADPAAAGASTGLAAPRIVVQPASVAGLLSQTAVLTVQATGSAPLRYQWEHDGRIVPGGTNAGLVLANLQAGQGGEYRVTVYNGAGAVVSSNATLSTALPAFVTSAPQTVRLRGSTNAVDYGSTTNRTATFSVQAVGSGSLRYQWRFNGTELPGETDSTLVVTNVDLSKDGIYDVLVADGSGAIASPPARLTVLISPVLVRVPLSVSVVSNGSFTASAVVRGNPPPFHFRWIEATLTRAILPSSETTNYYSFGPITNLVPRVWRVVVTNEANTLSTAISQFFVTALADSDGDGMPDAWENDFGLDPLDPADAGLDSDGDGLSNLEEFLAGTHPRDGRSYLRIEVGRAEGGNRLTFPAAELRSYTVEYRDSLETGGWVKLADVPPALEAHVETMVDPESRPHRYYRLVTPRRP